MSQAKKYQSKRQKARQKILAACRCSVYALINSLGEVVYVGQTKAKIPERMKWHRKQLKACGTRIYRYWRNEVAEGRDLTAQLLQGGAIWDVSEVLWIDKLRSAGEPLQNMTLGGKCPAVAMKIKSPSMIDGRPIVWN